MATATLPESARLVRRSSLLKRAFSGDSLAQVVVFVCATGILAITALLVWELWTHSAASRMKFGFNFLRTTTWDPVKGEFGALPFIYGTVVTSAIALAIAIPFGVGAAIFLAEMAPPKLSDA